jgi:hypothetical protein
LKETKQATEAKAAAAEHPPAAANHIQLAMPIVYRTSKKKKGERRYTKGLKIPQQLSRGGIRASERLSKGLDRGFSDFRKRSNKSSKKKRDGIIIDSVRNFTKGAGKGLRTASRAPNDLVKRVNTKWVTRQARIVMRTVAWPLFG